MEGMEENCIEAEMVGGEEEVDISGSDRFQENVMGGAEKSEGRKTLEKWLNKSMKIQMTDNRTLIGVFLCTDRDRNVILGSCEEYLKPLDSGEKEEPRILGLAMVPGHHIVSIHIDEDRKTQQSIL